MLQRPRAIARSCQRAHQLDRHACIQRVQRSETTPPVRGRNLIPARAARACELVEGLGMALRERVALRLHPAIELWTARKAESIEKWPTVLRYRGLEVSLRRQLLELIDVAVDDRRLEPQLTHPRNCVRRPEISAQRIEGVIERVAAGLLVGVGP